MKTKMSSGGWKEEDEVGNEEHSSGKILELGLEGELDQLQRQVWNRLYSASVSFCTLTGDSEIEEFLNVSHFPSALNAVCPQ